MSGHNYFLYFQYRNNILFQYLICQVITAFILLKDSEQVVSIPYMSGHNPFKEDEIEWRAQVSIPYMSGHNILRSPDAKNIILFQYLICQVFTLL